MLPNRDAPPPDVPNVDAPMFFVRSWSGPRFHVEAERAIHLQAFVHPPAMKFSWAGTDPRTSPGCVRAPGARAPTACPVGPLSNCAPRPDPKHTTRVLHIIPERKPLACVEISPPRPGIEPLGEMSAETRGKCGKHRRMAQAAKPLQQLPTLIRRNRKVLDEACNLIRHLIEPSHNNSLWDLSAALKTNARRSRRAERRIPFRRDQRQTIFGHAPPDAQPRTRGVSCRSAYAKGRVAPYVLDGFASFFSSLCVAAECCALGHLGCVQPNSGRASTMEFELV